MQNVAARLEQLLSNHLYDIELVDGRDGRRATSPPRSHAAPSWDMLRIRSPDMLQSKAVIETVDGVQRIRGLAGSGKTIVLALKAGGAAIRSDSFDAAAAALGLTSLRTTSVTPQRRSPSKPGPRSLRLRAYLAMSGLPDMPGSSAAPLGVAVVCRDFRWVCALRLVADGVVSGGRDDHL